jgi:hypothetical protein
MKSINPNEAPEGFIAKKTTMLCGGCKVKRCLEKPEVKCCPSQREDGQLVIFVKKV